MQTHSRYRTARGILLFWTWFIGLGAVAGAAGMLLDPSGRAMGMDAMLPYFQVLPFADVLFQNFTFSGVALLIVNGLTNLTAAGLLLAKKRAGVVCGGIFGVTLMLWIGIQFYMFAILCLQAISSSACARRRPDMRHGCSPSRKASAWMRRITRTSAGGRNGWWCSFRAWAMCGSWRMNRRTARGRRFMRSGRRSGQRERPAFGGAGAMGCTGGRCRLCLSTSIWRHTNM